MNLRYVLISVMERRNVWIIFWWKSVWKRPLGRSSSLKITSVGGWWYWFRITSSGGPLISGVEPSGSAARINCPSLPTILDEICVWNKPAYNTIERRFSCMWLCNGIGIVLQPREGDTSTIVRVRVLCKLKTSAWILDSSYHYNQTVSPKNGISLQ